MQFEASINVSASSEKIFSVYAAVDKWIEWDKELESASLDGAFVLGGTGTVKPKGAPKTAIKITELTQNKSVTTVCQLPLCTMHFVHVLNAQGDGSTQVINRLEFTGLLTPVFGRLIGKSIYKTMPSTLQGLKSYVEQKA